jgi:hypothetical protein
MSMTSCGFERLVRAAYFTLRLIFYPIVLLLRPIVPFEPFTVGTLTLSLAQFFSIVLWNSGFGVAIALTVWITGTVLALCFILWGSHLAPPTGGRQDAARTDAGRRG